MAEAAAAGDPAEARGFEALGDANRREILRILSDGGKPVREIADAMTISRPAVSRHLRLLMDAGLVAEQVQDTRRIYRPAGARDRGGRGVPAARLEVMRPRVSACWPRTRGQIRSGARGRREARGVTAPLRMSFDVDCSPGHALTVWTSGIGTWWPADHTVTGQAGLSVVMQSGAGGRIYERTPDGAEHDWGEVTIWNPPHQLAYLWHLRRDRTDATEVEILFAANDSGGTRIEIEHRGWERLGRAAEQWREQSQAGGRTRLPHFQAMIAATIQNRRS